jgi:hypothetical protein
VVYKDHVRPVFSASTLEDEKVTVISDGDLFLLNKALQLKGVLISRDWLTTFGKIYSLTSGRNAKVHLR